MQQMELIGVRVELPSNTPIMLLREKGETTRLLPIFIGAAEATAISIALDDIPTPRPMTHDLLNNVVSKLSANLERVVITELRKRTFYAELHLKNASGLIVISSRPSDAVALAIRSNTPIYAHESVINSAGYRADGTPIKDQQETAMLEEFKKFIDTVSPEDFGN